MEGPDNSGVVSVYDNITVSIAIMKEPQDGELKGDGFHPTYIPPFALPTGLEPPCSPALTNDDMEAPVSQHIDPNTWVSFGSWQ